MKTPRCGKPMHLDGRYERSGEPGDPGKPPVCGRPAGHPGPCRSESAVARDHAAALDRQRRARERRRSPQIPPAELAALLGEVCARQDAARAVNARLPRNPAAVAARRAFRSVQASMPGGAA